MWLRRNKKLQVGLSCGRVTLSTRSNFWSSQSAVVGSANCPVIDINEPWRPAVTSLVQLLGDINEQKPALSIVLSGRFVRWQLLPWQAELTKPKELATYAKVRFGETYGNIASNWQILQIPQPPNRAVPACGIDTGLLATLRKVCEDSGASLDAVTPYFSAAFDRWRKTFKGNTVWFGLIESDSLSLGLLRNGDWASVRSQRLDGELHDVLQGMMVQTSISAGIEHSSAPLYLAGDGEKPLPRPSLPFTWLQPNDLPQRLKIGHRLALGV